MKYRYHINLDERGEFAACVCPADNEDDSANGEAVYSIDTEGARQLVEDGFMRHMQDLAGLQEHLISLGVLQTGDLLVT